MAVNITNPPGAQHNTILAQALGNRVVYDAGNPTSNPAQLVAAQNDYKALFKVNNQSIALVAKSNRQKAIVSQGLDIVTLSEDGDARALLTFTGNLISDVTKALVAEDPGISDFKEIVKGYQKWIFFATTIGAVLAGLGSFVENWYGATTALVYVVAMIILVNSINYIKQRIGG
jgi:hypothetical protein